MPAAGLAYIPAPKLKLPGHEESYNPPKEYLPTEVSETLGCPLISPMPLPQMSSPGVCNPSSQYAVCFLQEERKGFEQLDEEDRTKPLAHIYPSLRQVAL